MLANWSLVLNVLLLVGVIISIGRLMKVRRLDLNQVTKPLAPAIQMKEESSFFDDIIAVRRVGATQEGADKTGAMSLGVIEAEPSPKKTVHFAQSDEPKKPHDEPMTVMMFLQAKDNRMLAGYELLQTVLAAGLRFGEGNLFHRHQFSNGEGPVLCSLASATATGTFDLQNIGAFSVRGLCLFMQSSGNSSIDAERFNIMLETAKQLRDDLDANLLDFQQKSFGDETEIKYARLLNLQCTA